MDSKISLQQKVLASHLLMMLYTRSRNSDLAHVHEVSHDATRSVSPSPLAGYIQISTRYHKAARSVENKNLLLPIVASTVGVGNDDWVSTWIKLRRQANLPVAGRIDGALQPAPDLKKEGAWMSRPISCSETTMILRSMLGSSDKDLTSHALKVTGLSWSAKAEMPREQRRLLGRHASALKDTDSVYSRDLAFAPVRAFQKVLTMIQGGVFHPDEPRSQYFTGTNLMAPGTPMPMFQPATPAFARAAPQTPPPQWHDAALTPKVLATEMKEEETMPPTHGGEESGVAVVNLVTDSGSETSTSGCEDASSDDERQSEVSEGDAAPAAENVLKDAFVKNKSSGIIHRIPEVGHEVSDSVYGNGELLQRRITKCGRMTSSGFVVMQTIEDWTAKCRICFKGCRAPVLP